jgi:hypothetical protein
MEEASNSVPLPRKETLDLTTPRQTITILYGYDFQ